jgi:hypothetical protein
LDGPLPKWCPAVALSRKDGRHSAVALLLKAALIQVQAPGSLWLSNSHSKFPKILTIFFNSQLHLTIPICLFNSLILQYLPHVTHFPQTVPTLPFIRPFVRLLRHILHQHLFLIQPMV